MVGRMKTSKFITGILIMSSSALLFAHGYSASGEHDAGTQLADEQKLPQPGGGIQILPLSQLYPVSKPEKLMADFKAQKEKGYINVNSDSAASLLNYKKNKFFIGSEKTYLSNDIHDTHLKKSLSQIQLAFKHYPISFIEEKDVIGFAAAGAYQNGWTGLGETFNYKNLGTCDYIIHNLEITGGSAILAEEFVTYDINKKPTIITIKGNERSGFLTQIQWYDDIFYHTLECANESFNKADKSKVIELAKKIDLD